MKREGSASRGGRGTLWDLTPGGAQPADSKEGELAMTCLEAGEG